MDGLSAQIVAGNVIVYVASDGQVIQSPTTIICQIESGKSMFVPRILGTIING
jgi:hypothetical protein